jgi:hypothetical protein
MSFQDIVFLGRRTEGLRYQGLVNLGAEIHWHVFLYTPTSVRKDISKQALPNGNILSVVLATVLDKLKRESSEKFIVNLMWLIADFETHQWGCFNA